MLWLFEKMFFGLLSSLVNGSNYAKGVLVRNQKCMIYLYDLNIHVFNLITRKNE